MKVYFPSGKNSYEIFELLTKTYGIDTNYDTILIILKRLRELVFDFMVHEQDNSPPLKGNI
jgi:hypothetical protein